MTMKENNKRKALAIKTKTLLVIFCRVYRITNALLTQTQFDQDECWQNNEVACCLMFSSKEKQVTKIDTRTKVNYFSKICNLTKFDNLSKIKNLTKIHKFHKFDNLTKICNVTNIYDLIETNNLTKIDNFTKIENLHKFCNTLKIDNLTMIDNKKTHYDSLYQSIF